MIGKINGCIQRIVPGDKTCIYFNIKSSFYARPYVSNTSWGSGREAFGLITRNISITSHFSNVESIYCYPKTQNLTKLEKTSYDCKETHNLKKMRFIISIIFKAIIWTFQIKYFHRY